MEWYPESKVYFDGSHYVAIPHTERPRLKKRYRHEEIITVDIDSNSAFSNLEGAPIVVQKSKADELIIKYNLQELTDKEAENCPFKVDKIYNCPDNMPQRTGTLRKVTRKQLFNELYKANIELKRWELKKVLVEGMSAYFKTEEGTEKFVESNLERVERNIQERRKRFKRKAYNQKFNYFTTFTYSDKKHTEETFKKKLMYTLSNAASKKGWKYMGVWERGELKGRLHFHGLFSIPDGTLSGGFIDTNDYNFRAHERKMVHQSNFFLDRFGRNDFEEIGTMQDYGRAIAYILKYIEKSGDKIVYSRGLYQYFISDIEENDVLATMGLDDQKLVLSDKFTCWDEGVMIGEVNENTIKQLRKAN
jgi:hypothetical protein